MNALARRVVKTEKFIKLVAGVIRQNLDKHVEKTQIAEIFTEVSI